LISRNSICPGAEITAARPLTDSGTLAVAAPSPIVAGKVMVAAGFIEFFQPF
jgi:hypothetical protein